MAGKAPNYTVIPNDWLNLEYIISDLCSRIIDSDVPLSKYLLADGTRPLTANWDVGAFSLTALKYTSDVAVGTSPYACTSTTLNTNLNADLLDGQHGAYYASAAGYLSLDQTTPQTFTDGDVSGSGLLKVTEGLLGLDETEYLSGTHNLLSATHGDILANAAIKGGLIYGNATPKWAYLAGDNTGTKKVLCMTSLVPSWGTLNLANILAQGGTVTEGYITITSGNIIITTGNISTTNGEVHGYTIDSFTSVKGTSFIFEKGTYDLNLTASAISTSEKTVNFTDRSGDVMITGSNQNWLTTGTLGAGAITGTSVATGTGAITGGAITASSSLISYYSQDAAIASPKMYFQRKRTTGGDVLTGDYLGGLIFQGYRTGYLSGAIIRGVASGTITGSSELPTRLEFCTSAEESATPTTNWSILPAGTLVSGTDGTGSQGILTAGTLSAGAITGTSLTGSGLTSGRIPIIGASGLLGDSATLVSDGTNLSIGEALDTTTCLNAKKAVSCASAAQNGIYSYIINSVAAGNYNLIAGRFDATVTKGTQATAIGVWGSLNAYAAVSNGYGLYFQVSNKNSTLLASSTAVNAVTDCAGSDTGCYIYSASGVRPSFSATHGRIGTAKALNLLAPTKSSDGVFDLYYGLYIEDLVMGSTTTPTDTWAIYSLGGKSWHAGDFAFGGSTRTPSYGVDVATTLGVTGLTTATGGSTTGDGTNKTDISATGTLTMSGTARVSKIDWLVIGAFKAPGTKPADYVDYGLGGGWEFSNATDDTVVATRRLPQDMDKTFAPSFKIGWGSAETSGDVVWQLEYLYIAAGENLANTTPDGTVPETTTVSGTANGLNVTSIAMYAPSASDQLLKVRIKRLGADGSDTLSGTAIMVGCGFNYTSDKLGVALT